MSPDLRPKGADVCCIQDQLQDRIEKEVKTGVDEITTLNASIGGPWKVNVGKAWGVTGGFWTSNG